MQIETTGNISADDFFEAHDYITSGFFHRYVSLKGLALQASILTLLLLPYLFDYKILGLILFSLYSLWIGRIYFRLIRHRRTIRKNENMTSYAMTVITEERVIHRELDKESIYRWDAISEYIILKNVVILYFKESSNYITVPFKDIDSNNSRKQFLAFLKNKFKDVDPEYSDDIMSSKAVESNVTA